MNTFYKWLIKQDYRNDAVGDLATSLKDDEPFLPEKKTKNNLISHLVYKEVDDIEIYALQTAWKEYKNYRKNI